MARILIIDSDENLRRQWEERLASGGHEVVGAKDGRDGAMLVRSRMYDLVVCDIAAEKKSGTGLFRELKDDPVRKMFPFIFLAPQQERKTIRDAMELGAEDVLVKPFPPEELVRAVEACLKKRHMIEAYFHGKFGALLKLEKRIFFDNQTRLPNRLLLDRNLTALYGSLAETLRCFVISFSIDGYDEITALMGTKTLGQIVERIIEHVRGFLDKSEELYCLGENDFCVLSYLHLLADRVIDDEYFLTRTDLLLETIRRPFDVSKHKISFSASIGVDFCDAVESIESVHATIENARQANSYVSHSGGNGYKRYSHEIRRRLVNTLSPSLKKHIFIRDEAKSGEPTEEKEDSVDLNECRVFFLYPPSIIEEKIIHEVIKNEFQAYLIKDHRKIRQVVGKYPNCVLFIDIDTMLSEPEWEKYIREMMAAPETEHVRIGVLTFYGNPERAKKYLFELKVPCGFITLRTSYVQCTDIILKVLNAVEALGRRKYIRINCAEMPSVSVFITIKGEKIGGVVFDVSSVGMACIFPNEMYEYLEKLTILEGIQLNLRGKLCLIKGDIVGKRYTIEKNTVYIVMFAKYIGSDVRDKIHAFIALCLQEQIDRELVTVK